jgi:hypothetical protein
MFIVMAGNLSEGYVAYGPYATFDDAANAHVYEECWIMEVTNKEAPNGNV